MNVYNENSLYEKSLMEYEDGKNMKGIVYLVPVVTIRQLA